MELWRHCWRRQWLWRVYCSDCEWDLCMECLLRFTSYFVSFSWLFYTPCYKMYWEWLPVHCGDQRHTWLCLGRRPTARAGSPTKAQTGVPLISTMHGQPFLLLLTTHGIVLWVCVHRDQCVHKRIYIQMFTDMWCAFVVNFFLVVSFHVKRAMIYCVLLWWNMCVYWGSDLVCNWTKRRTQMRAKLLGVPTNSVMFQYTD